MVLKKLPKQLGGGESMRGCVQSVRNAFEMETFEEVSERERVFYALSAFSAAFPPFDLFCIFKISNYFGCGGGETPPPPPPPILRCARLSAAFEGCRERAKRASFL